MSIKIIGKDRLPIWMLPMMLGIFIGLSSFTFFYAKGVSYFSNDPRVCKNCHIMRVQFDAWNRSSHKRVATCNSCHTPKDILGKYAVKGLNGWNHSVAFTTGHFHEPLRIRPFNREIVLQNCKTCHKDVVSLMASNQKGEMADCLTCHAQVGHRSRK